jgi:hypothetical protein
MSHSECPVDGPQAFTREVSAADAILRERFPRPQRLFCYPYGGPHTATSETARMLSGLGMDAAFVTQGGAARAGRHGLLELRREDANYSPGSVKLAALLALVR